jgi:hypothetical protein
VKFLKGFFPTAGAAPYRLGHDSLLHVIEARRGRGKSYAMMHVILDALEAGIPVVTNTSAMDYYRVAVELCRRGKFRLVADALLYLHDRVTVARSWDDFFRAYGSLVVFDECIRHFDARPGLSAKPPALFYEWARQTRKVNCTMYFVVHSVEWMDKRLTQLVDVHWFVRKESVKGRLAPDGTSYPERFWLYGNDPGGVGKVENVTRNTADLVCSIPFDVRVARCYESRGLIAELLDTTSFDSVGAIREYHLELGREVGIDGESRLRDLLRFYGTDPEECGREASASEGADSVLRAMARLRAARLEQRSVSMKHGQRLARSGASMA